MPAGSAPRYCLGYKGHACPRKIRGGSRCAECKRLHEADRERAREGDRSAFEPWRVLYRLAEWKRVRRERLVLDGFRCVDCRGKAEEVDHVTPLRNLWNVAGGSLSAFVSLACDVDDLRSRCRSCHGLVEARRRAEA